VRRGEAPVSDRLWTLPNVLSALRLVGVPIFIWAILSGRDGIALATLMLSGLSDYLDGKIARHFHLESRLGQLLDPVADRLYILSTLLGLAYRDIIPWWLVAVLISREVFLSVGLLIAKRHGYLGVPVHFIGKAATFNLLYAFPLLLLAQGDSTFAEWALPIGWAFAWWGTILYWMAGIMYAVQIRQLVVRSRRSAAHPRLT
jgi:cardiolipin synthase